MPSSRPVVSGPIPVNLVSVARRVDLSPEAGSLFCPDCGVPLSLHQPDENQPSQLLGTCSACSKWVLLVEIEPDSNRALLVELPGIDAVRDIVDRSDRPR